MRLLTVILLSFGLLGCSARTQPITQQNSAEVTSNADFQEKEDEEKAVPTASHSTGGGWFFGGNGYSGSSHRSTSSGFSSRPSSSFSSRPSSSRSSFSRSSGGFSRPSIPRGKR